GDTASFLADALASRGDGGNGEVADASLRRIAEAAVEERRRAGLRVPGLGHPVHRVEDPRVPRLYALAAEEELLGPHLRLLALVAEVHEDLTGRRLPIHGAGAGGAALVDAALPPRRRRGLAPSARAARLAAPPPAQAQ